LNHLAIDFSCVQVDSYTVFHNMRRRKMCPVGYGELYMTV